jgi:hypothetical protein
MRYRLEEAAQNLTAPVACPQASRRATTKALYKHARFHKITGFQVAWQNSHKDLRVA